MTLRQIRGPGDPAETAEERAVREGWQDLTREDPRPFVYALAVLGTPLQGQGLEAMNWRWAEAFDIDPLAFAVRASGLAQREQKPRRIWW